MADLSSADQLTFHTHRGKMLAFVGVVVLFAWLPAMRAEDPMWHRVWLITGGLMTVLGVALFVLAMRREPRLVFTEQGFALTSWLRTNAYRWRECHEFQIHNFVGVDVIYFRRHGYRARCGIMNLFDAPTEVIVKAIDERSARARDVA